METITYYIYEIPGRKVGCTKNLKARMYAQRAVRNHRVVATTNCIEEAGRLELEWQEKLGYTKDVRLYSKVVPAVEKAVRGRVVSEEAKRAISEGSKKRHSNPEVVYPTTHRARYFKELSTGFVGTIREHVHKFNICYSYMSREYLGCVKTRGKHKGKCWIEVPK
jgi:hypothetical protein